MLKSILENETISELVNFLSRIESHKHFYKIIFGLIMFMLYLFPNDESSKSSFVPNKLIAYNYAIEFVTPRLKSPSTAKFPGASIKNSHVVELERKTFLINSWVDSQNSFGAMTRSNFSCKIIFDNESVRCKNLIVK